MNPAKTTDSRFASYRQQHGDESWELDALKPEYLDRLVRKHIRGAINDSRWTTRKHEVEEIRKRLKKVAEDFEA